MGSYADNKGDYMQTMEWYNEDWARQRFTEIWDVQIWNWAKVSVPVIAK